MLTRSIDPSGPAFTEKLALAAKRLCLLLAGSALGLGALDLTNIRSADSATKVFSEARLSVADLPGRIRTEIGNISFMPSSPSVTVQIPRTQVAKASLPLSLPVKSGASPVAELASLRQQDAIEMAMAAPPAFAKPQPSIVEAARASLLAPPTVRLASVDTSSLPAVEAQPAPVSLPMSAAIPLDMVPMPREAPGAPPPSPAERLKLEGKEYAKAERCLANAIYFEARSEPIVGQKAVAQVVINRAFSGFYPNDICGVVYQNAHRRLACQFTFACDGKSKAILDRGSWARANRIARETLNGHIYVPEVAKSTHYHAVYVHPNWVREMKKMVRYGVHNFYRPIAWGNGAEEPVWGSPALLAQVKKK